MNKYSKLFNVGPRGVGRTHALIKACKSIDGTFVCVNMTQEKNIRRRDTEVKTINLSTRSEGLRGPFIFDHYTMECIYWELTNHIRELEHQIVLLEKIHE